MVIEHWRVQYNTVRPHSSLGIGHRHFKQSCRSKRGMEMWKTPSVSHIPTPPAATTDDYPTRRYTNNLLGTNDRSAHDR